MADKHSAKYLLNPDTGRVMINTALKRRVRPGLVPCNKLDGSDVLDDARVIYARERSGDSPVIEDTPEPKTNETVQGGFDDILLQVQDSEDKAEVRQIAADLGLNLSKTLKLKTMKDEVLGVIREMQEQAK